MSQPVRDTPARAAIYREAARRIEYLSDGYACNEIFEAAGGDWEEDDRDTHPLVVRFHDFYKPDGEHESDPYFGENTDARIVALCLIAAMVESGDA